MINSQYKKITHALRYLISKNEHDRVNILLLMKLVWASDRYHARKYGRLISDGTYRALPKGPICSTAYDIANESDYLSQEQCEYSKQYVVRDRDNDVVGVTGPEMDYLSETDIEALDFAWKKFGHKDRFEVVDITHKYPEWKQYQPFFDTGGSSQSIDVRDFFQNPGEKDEYFDVDTELLNGSRQKIEQDLKIRQALKA